MNEVKIIFDFLGYFSTGIVIIEIFLGVWGWISGIIPVLISFGSGLAKRKIAILAKGDHLISLKNLLVDSRFIRKKNIISISTQNDLGMMENASIFLVFFHDWKNNINQILDKKSDGNALILYAPRELGDIPNDCLDKLSELRNTMVTNFRGRLLSDIVTSMITTNK